MTNVNPNTLIATAGIVIAFSLSVIIFRVQRELKMYEKGEITWIAYSDWLCITAIIVAIFLIIAPLLIPAKSESFLRRLPIAATFAALVFIVGYVFGILAHYRLIFGKERKRKGLPRVNPEPSEKIIVNIFFVLAVALFFLTLFY